MSMQEEVEFGADGRWPHEDAFRARLRSHDHPLTLLEIARHEAGHVVVAHALGTGVKRASAGLSEDRDARTTRLGVTIEDGELRSNASSLLVTLAGRVEDERQGLYEKFVIKPGQDEWATLVSAHALSNGEPKDAARLIEDAWIRTKAILDEWQAGVADIASALAMRDLNAHDVTNILGALPPCTFEPGGTATDVRFNETFVGWCLSAMTKGRPFAVALIDSKQPWFAWFRSDGTLMKTPLP